MDVDEFKQRQAHIWGMGDYTLVSRILAPAAEAVCQACAVSAGQEVLDVGAGDGNFALACAREGASVIATDISPGQVERGRARSEAEGYEVEWQEADAEDLPFEDDRFDCVGSVFGAMIAPRPRVAASELVRVARPGGAIGMTAWLAGSPVTEMFAIGRRYGRMPPDQPKPEAWADEETARERFEGLPVRLELERRTLVWEGESAEGLVDQLMERTPQWAAIRESLSPEQLDAARGELLEIARSAGGDGPLRLDTDYRLILARKRG
jgi:SAM-dependent methyltransferase